MAQAAAGIVPRGDCRRDAAGRIRATTRGRIETDPAGPGAENCRKRVSHNRASDSNRDESRSHPDHARIEANVGSGNAARGRQPDRGPGNRARAIGSAGSARATPTAADPTLARQATECGGIQEAAIDLSIGQTLNGVSIRATKAAVFPIAYFRCILMATGGNEAFSLASSVGKSERDGATHAVLVDLWITNSGKDFGQLNLKTAALAAAGQTFAPLATLGGRAEVVISGGQGRSVTVVFAVKDSVGASIGPVTLVADAPLVGGKKMAGKYQLFLPTP